MGSKLQILYEKLLIQQIKKFEIQNAYIPKYMNH